MVTVEPMSPEREAHLIDQVGKLGSHAEALGFRAAISAGREQMTADLMAALRDRIDVLAKRENVR